MKTHLLSRAAGCVLLVRHPDGEPDGVPHPRTPRRGGKPWKGLPAPHRAAVSMRFFFPFFFLPAPHRAAVSNYLLY